MCPNVHERINSEEVATLVRTQGFAIVRGGIPQETLDALVSDCRRVFGQAARQSTNAVRAESASDADIFELFTDDYPRFLGAARAIQHLPGVFALAANQHVLDLVQGAGVRFPTVAVKPIVYFNSPRIAKVEGHWKTPAHQDWRSIQGSLNSVVVWTPLVDIRRELGPLEVVPGSHLWGLLESSPDDWYRRIEHLDDELFQPVELSVGDALVFSTLLVHRSGTNTSDSIRWSLHLRFNDLTEPSWAKRGYVHPYKVYTPESELVTPGFPSEGHAREYFRGVTDE